MIKRAFLYDFVGTCTSNILSPRSVKWIDIKKIILQPFRPIKIDAFSYSSHWNSIRTRWDRVCEKKVSIFFTYVCFPYWVLYMHRIRLSMICKINQKSNFSKVDFIGWKGWKVNSMLEIDWLEPKWHLKSLVLICYIFWVMKTHIWKVFKTRGLCRIHIYQLDFLPHIHCFSSLVHHGIWPFLKTHFV